MDAITQYFDHYVITARIKPAFFVVLPLAVTAVVWWPGAQELGGSSSQCGAEPGTAGGNGQRKQGEW